MNIVIVILFFAASFEHLKRKIIKHTINHTVTLFPNDKHLEPSPGKDLPYSEAIMSSATF